jgi:hypothetical protein
MVISRVRWLRLLVKVRWNWDVWFFFFLVGFLAAVLLVVSPLIHALNHFDASLVASICKGH